MKSRVVNQERVHEQLLKVESLYSVKSNCFVAIVNGRRIDSTEVKNFSYENHIFSFEVGEEKFSFHHKYVLKIKRVRSRRYKILFEKKAELKVTKKVTKKATKKVTKKDKE